MPLSPPLSQTGPEYTTPTRQESWRSTRRSEPFEDRDHQAAGEVAGEGVHRFHRLVKVVDGVDVHLVCGAAGEMLVAPDDHRLRPGPVDELDVVHDGELVLGGAPDRVELHRGRDRGRDRAREHDVGLLAARDQLEPPAAHPLLRDRLGEALVDRGAAALVHERRHVELLQPGRQRARLPHQVVPAPPCHQHTQCEERASDHGPRTTDHDIHAFTTNETIRSGTWTTLTISFPSSHRAAASRAAAAAASAARPGSASSVARTLPLTCTASVTRCEASSEASYAGQPARSNEPSWPSARHSSSVMCGANGCNSLRSVS